ncbi:MAG: terminase small subunit [Ruminococcus sp.]
MPDSDIKQKRKKFCCSYVLLGNVREAAISAGFPADTALMDGVECLESADCKRLISKLRLLLADSGSVISGLKRLAFGSCSDAVYLVFADELPPAEVISGLDLFNVSEIKRVKGGGVEVKLFDRQKALEKLFEFENTCSDKGCAESLIAALTKPAEEAEFIEN